MTKMARKSRNKNYFDTASAEKVFITEIVDPSQFFVRKVQYQPIYQRLCNDLTREYALNYYTESVHLPVIGMSYAVNLDWTGTSEFRQSRQSRLECRWERGVVCELPGQGRVRVLLCDNGGMPLVHWRALKHLQPHLSRLAPLAAECYLIGLTPLNKRWCPESVAMLHQFQGRPLDICVKDKRRDAVGVTLHDTANEHKVICLNAEMVHHKFAKINGTFEVYNEILDSQNIDQASPVPIPDQQQPQIKPNNQAIILNEKSSLELSENVLEINDKRLFLLEAKILQYDSPSSFYAALINQQNNFSKLYEKIQRHYSKIKTHKIQGWVENDRCCTFSNESQTWRRAVIISMEGTNAKVFYTDFALEETVPISSLRNLTPEFASFDAAAFKCHLCNILPVLGEKLPMAKEYFKELLDAYPTIFLAKTGEIDDNSMPVELWIRHTTLGAALTPKEYEWRCLNQMIIEHALAVSEKTKQPTHEKALESLDDPDAWLPSEPLPTKTPNSDQDVSEVGACSNMLCISDWLPAKPLGRKEFTGLVTFIDRNGFIYLQDVAQQDTLDIISKALDVRFIDLPDPKSKLTKWTVGQPCIAKIRRFYRGRVLEVNEETSTCIIHYVDYGNNEPCAFENLRSSGGLHTIPVQAQRCVLTRIRPAGEPWDSATLDYIRKAILYKKCFVRVTGDSIGGVTPVDLKNDKLWIKDYFVDFKVAEYNNISKALASQVGPDSIKAKSLVRVKCNSNYGMDRNPPVEAEESNSISGTFHTYPDNESKDFLCNINIINDYEILNMRIIHDEESKHFYEKLYEEIQKEGQNMPPLNIIFSNRACIARLPKDGLWYRGTILQYNEETQLIKVRYVDYGNTEIVCMADIRETKKVWTNWPPSCIQAKLHKITINAETDIEEIYKKYTETFLFKEPFRATVKSKFRNISIVELRNAAGELVYENLIKQGIFSYDIKDTN